jgi:hypothetical protein
MSIYTYQEAQQHFVEILEEAKNNTVMVTNQKGEVFSIAKMSNQLAQLNLTRAEIVSYVRETRER